MFFEHDGLGLEILDIFFINRKNELIWNTSNRPFSVISFRLSGTAHLYQDDTVYSLDDTNILYIPKLCAYSQETPGESIVAIHLNVYGLQSQKIEVISAPQAAKKFFIDIYRIWTEKSKNYKYKCQIMLMEFLMELPNKEVSTINYIHKKLADPKLSIAMLAQRAHVSESFFRRDFKKKYGISPLQYINNTRIERAKNLLTTNYYSIAEVALLSGFENSNYFCTAFKKSVGQTPSKYKKASLQQDLHD